MTPLRGQFCTPKHILLAIAPTFSRFGASDKPGAVHVHDPSMHCQGVISLTAREPNTVYTRNTFDDSWSDTGRASILAVSR
jgi:hypothetical protein